MRVSVVPSDIGFTQYAALISSIDVEGYNGRLFLTADEELRCALVVVEDELGRWRKDKQENLITKLIINVKVRITIPQELREQIEAEQNERQQKTFSA